MKFNLFGVFWDHQTSVWGRPVYTSTAKRLGDFGCKSQNTPQALANSNLIARSSSKAQRALSSQNNSARTRKGPNLPAKGLPSHWSSDKHIYFKCCSLVNLCFKLLVGSKSLLLLGDFCSVGQVSPSWSSSGGSSSLFPRPSSHGPVQV